MRNCPVVYALFPQGRYHQTSKDLLRRGARSEVQLRLTVSAAADVIHRAMILEFLAQGQVQRSADWANESILPNIRQAAEQVRTFGEREQKTGKSANAKAQGCRDRAG